VDEIPVIAKSLSLTVVEINSVLAAFLNERFSGNGWATICADFLEIDKPWQFDRVVMNPPFVNGSDIKHVRHALKMVKPGGRLVAIVAAGPRQHEAFVTSPPACCRKVEWIPLPADSFADQGTNVNTAIVVIDVAEKEPEPTAERTGAAFKAWATRRRNAAAKGSQS